MAKKMKTIMIVSLAALVLLVSYLSVSVMSKYDDKELVQGTKMKDQKLQDVQSYSLQKDTGDKFNRNFLKIPKNATSSYVSEIVKKNKGIRMVRYYDTSEERYVSYVRIANDRWIGKDFMILPDQVYEIIISDDSTLNITLTS